MFNLLLQPVLAPLMRCRMPSASCPTPPHPACSARMRVSLLCVCVNMELGNPLARMSIYKMQAGRADIKHLGRRCGRTESTSRIEEGKWEVRGRRLLASSAPEPNRLEVIPTPALRLAVRTTEGQTPQQQLRVHSRFSPSMAQLQPVS